MKTYGKKSELDRITPNGAKCQKMSLSYVGFFWIHNFNKWVVVMIFFAVMKLHFKPHLICYTRSVMSHFCKFNRDPIKKQSS